MCLILFAHRLDPKYSLVLAANRDEFFQRPTAFADFWPEAPQVLGGRDLEKSGTWMGINRDGRWAAVTNFRDGTRPEAGARSRGELVARYLQESMPAQAYLSLSERSAREYHGFNLLVADQEGLHYLSNRGAPSRLLKPGIYGLSNHLLDSPWPKVESGKRALQGWLGADSEELTEALFSLLADRNVAEERLLPRTGVSSEWERLLSAAFISAPDYGTRSSSVLLINRSGEAHFRERSFGANGSLIEDRRFELTLAPDSSAVAD